MDKIIIDNLNIYAYHGVYKEEKEKGQVFQISCTLFLDLSAPSVSDELTDTVNYAEVCSVIKEVCTAEKFDLIEALAEKISSTILCKYNKVEKVQLKVSKPDAPIDMDFENVSVFIERKKHRVYLSIGSNLGDKEENLNYAVNQLKNDEYINVRKVSSFIVTEPYGPVEQPDFLNGAVELDTLYSPHEFLSIINDIEKERGRERIIHWGPRTLDIDILLYDDIVMSDETLTIPHIELPKRDFVLRPLTEIAPYVRHPISKKTAKELLHDLNKKLKNKVDDYYDEDYSYVEKLHFDDGDKAVFAGVPGAYAEMAMFKFFGNDVPNYHVKTFEDVVNEVHTGKAKYGVIPIENSSAGFVTGSYDIIRRSNVKIVGEVILDIEHALLGLPEAELSDIKKVYSHKQGLMQCESYINNHNFIQSAMDNTALAAKKVKENGNIDCAAIASERAAELYGLKVLDRRINFSNDNATRFAVVANEKVAVKTSDKILICFSTPHKCGSLYKIMGYFMDNGVNMTSIESRPSLRKKWEYYFYVSFEGKLSDKNIAHCLGEIREETEECIILGTY